MPAPEASKVPPGQYGGDGCLVASSGTLLVGAEHMGLILWQQNQPLLRRYVCHAKQAQAAQT